MQPAYAANMWNEALNKRLGTEVNIIFNLHSRWLFLPIFSIVIVIMNSCLFLLFQDLDLYGILEETEKRGIAFDELLTIPEQDEWVYSDGKSTTCVSFILSMYKEAGVFGPITNSMQVTEFTVSHYANRA